jgi:uncharacterized protein (DUF3084 family)
MDGVPEGVEDRRHIEIDPRVMAPQVASWKRYVLGERSVPVDADAPGVGAEHSATGHTVAASAAHEVSFSAYKITKREFLHIRAELDYLTNEFVADQQRGFNVGLCPLVP